MSDTTRQSLSDRISAAITPDSLKDESTVTQQRARGGLDSVQAKAQPDSEKSYIQTAADKMRDLTENPSGSLQSQSGSGTAPSSGWGTSGADTTGGSSMLSGSSGTGTTSTTAPQGANDRGLLETISHAFGMDKDKSA
ncbi:hypothetical protein BCR44DRAFT_1437851 [Catenaria anguillulae PL171]|uniref:Uncharacterized protein n=1 Tax=Catenaria anguillulae PL171 TaxID=765915 RepID=A0A1Y2HI20_9FUNG|nr:hypothetical protein BCR44DRAFT_1437851 [Catenaria anguillulae PL171]